MYRILKALHNWTKASHDCGAGRSLEDICVLAIHNAICGLMSRS